MVPKRPGEGERPPVPREAARQGRAARGARERGEPQQGRWAAVRREVLRDLLIGLILLAMGAPVAAFYDMRLAERSEARENTRFVRQVVIDGATGKPFGGLDLRGASLAGLDLGCDDVDAARQATFVYQRVDAGCADLRGADLRGADLSGTQLNFALLRDADLRGADLDDADLVGAELGRAVLAGSELSRTDVSDADLRGADLDGAVLDEACYSEGTRWPEGYSPPPDPDCTSHAERIDPPAGADRDAG